MNILPDDIFNTIDNYWNKTIIYTFPKQLEDHAAEYLEDSYQRSTHFHDYIKVDNIPDFRLGKFTFTFDIVDDLLLEWNEEDDYFKHSELADEFAMKVQINWNAENCTCHDYEICRECELKNFKKNILNELRINYMYYYHSLNKFNYLNDVCRDIYNNEDFTKQLHICEDDYKCINRCDFHVKENNFERKLDNIDTLYCRVCVNKFKNRQSEFYAYMYAEYISELVFRYKNKYDEIIDFLRNPIPEHYWISGYGYGNKLLFTLSDII